MEFFSKINPEGTCGPSWPGVVPISFVLLLYILLCQENRQYVNFKAGLFLIIYSLKHVKDQIKHLNLKKK